MQCKLNVSFEKRENLHHVIKSKVMTTFTSIIDAILSSLAHLLPISEAVVNELNTNLLHASPIGNEMKLLISLVGALSLLFFFRFDWLGMISAFLKSIVQPLSLKSEARTLDQHTLMFILLIFIPHFIIQHFLTPVLAEIEFLSHPLVSAALYAILAFGFHFSYRWNKRIHGLNHLKLIDGVFIGLISTLSVIPAFPYLGLLWIGFALFNYHFEAIFKYSMLSLGLCLISEAISLLSSVGLRASFESVGHLNSVAVLVISFTIFTLGLENLNKNMNEGTYKTFKWISLLSGLVMVVVYFLRD